MVNRSIGIDCRLGGVTHAGIGRYIVELVSRLITSQKSIHWTLFCQDQKQAEEVMGGTKPENVTVVLAPIKQYSLQEQTILPGIFSRENLDLLHVPHFNVPLLYTKPVVVTIHDLLWHEYTGTQVTTLPKILYWPKYLGYRFIASHTIQKAVKIFVPTYTVKETVLRHYPRVERKVVVTREGIGRNLLSLAKKSVPKKRKRFHLLYVGSLYPHKNVSLLLCVLQRLPEYTLDIVSARSVFQDRLKEEVEMMHVSEQVQFLGRLSDEELAKAYQTAGILVQPSVSEGFGLTGLEGLAFETPLLASDIPIFHEVYQNAAIFFTKTSVDSCIAGLRQLENPDTQAELRKNSATVISQYSWDRLVEETFSGYEQALSGK